MLTVITDVYDLIETVKDGRMPKSEVLFVFWDSLRIPLWYSLSITSLLRAQIKMQSLLSTIKYGEI